MLPLEGKCTNVMEGLTFKGEIVKNPSVSLSPTLARNEKVEHYIRIKTHKSISLRFWVESGVNASCNWTKVSLVLYPLVNLLLCKPNMIVVGLLHFSVERIVS